jgi:hypothetical protein
VAKNDNDGASRMPGKISSCATALMAALVVPLVPAVSFAQAISGSGASAEPGREASTSKVAASIDSTGDDQGGIQDQTLVANQYQPQGIKVGQFLIFPDASLAEASDSNIYAVENDVKSDWITKVNPKARVESQFKRHALNFGVDLEHEMYAKHTDDDQTNVRLNANGRYDLTNDSELNFASFVGWVHEDRGSPDAVNGKEPTPYMLATLDAGGKTTQGRWLYALSGNGKRYDFDNVSTSAGTTIDNDNRDRDEMSLTGRVGYEFVPGYFALGQLTGDKVSYDDSVNAGGVDRSSTGYNAQTGIGVDVTQLIRGDFLVGYFSTDVDDPSASDPSGLSVKAVFNWTPTKQTLVVPSLSREAMETTKANSSAMVRTGASVLVRHELRRNIIVSAYAGADHDEYEGLDGDAWTYQGRGSATYAFNENLYTGLDLSIRDKQQDDNLGTNYTETVIMARIGVRM